MQKLLAEYGYGVDKRFECESRCLWPTAVALLVQVVLNLALDAAEDVDDSYVLNDNATEDAMSAMLARDALIAESWQPAAPIKTKRACILIQQVLVS